MKFKIGDRVCYTSGKYGAALCNPLAGTQYECKGTVAGIEENVGSVDVDWDNDTQNSYYEDDLIPAAGKLDPNTAFRLKMSKKRR